MSWLSRRRVEIGSGPVLRVDRLNVYYGRAHALQDVSFTLDRGILAIVGRNGMGKTTLCNAITGLVAASGSIKFGGTETVGLPPHAITALGIGYVPQGRRVWPSLTVDEHLRLAAGSAHRGVWTIERVYDLFPRLAERRNNGGYQLSGGEQQMLAIARALLLNPRLLVMDEPTEGLAPVIIQQIGHTIRALKGQGFTILLVEQNFRFASTVADRYYIMEHGRVVERFANSELDANMEKLHDYLGV
jgi:ABC-type branched-subunit amino acid transport system ATPase component